jgi:acetoin utilization deacetylase AcuC-like enzyme
VNTGFIYDTAFLSHDTTPGHPECHERLLVTMSHLLSLPWFENLHQLSAKTVEENWLVTTHAGSYIQHAKESCAANQPYLDSMDVNICPASFDIALLAAGAPIVLADAVLEEKIDNGFVLARPPGHHAERNQAMGFCLFNNVAILARYLQQHHQINKVLILDWDVHHGNGSQHTFEEDPSVLYISTHEFPYYPGTGAYSETGIGKGDGATLNCPMSAGASDRDYELAFMDKILPKIDAFKPEFIIISAGFDAHIDDPLGHICLSTDFYAWMTQRVLEMANKHCYGRIVSVLEGGYNLTALPLCVEEHLSVMSGIHA